MTQFARPTLDAAVDDGITLSTKFNGALPALYTNHAGPAAPPSPEKGQMWVDTSQEAGTPPTLALRQYTGTVWREVGLLNLTTGAFTTAGGLPLTGGTVTGPILFPSGTAALPSVAFAGDPDTGMFRVSADRLGWSTNGVQRMDMTNANLTFNLTTLNLNSGGNTASVFIDRANATSGWSNIVFRTGTSTRWTFQMSGAESTGNAGSNFTLMSHDDAGTLISNYLQIGRASRQMGINGAALGTATLTVRTNGAAPAEDALELINANTDLNGSVGMNFRTAGGALRAALRAVRPGNNHGDLQVHTGTTGVLNLAATFRANGDFQTQGCVFAGRGVIFNTSDQADWTQHRWRWRWSGPHNGIVINLNDTDLGYGVRAPNIVEISLGSGVMNIADNVGGFWSVMLNASDRRLKENIETSGVDALSEILAIPTFRFNWKPGAFGEETDKSAAPVAQPIGLVTDTLPNDCVQRSGTYEGVNLLPLVARLVKAMQQQDAVIKSLEARIVALEGKS